MKLIVALLGICFLNNLLAEDNKIEVVIDDDYEDEQLHKENEKAIGDFMNNLMDHTNKKVKPIKVKTKISKEATSDREHTSKNSKKRKSLKKTAQIEKNVRNLEETSDKPPYWGENFPKKYFEVDPTEMTVETLNIYVNMLNRTVNYFSTKLNKTDVNVGLGLYFTGGN